MSLLENLPKRTQFFVRLNKVSALEGVRFSQVSLYTLSEKIRWTKLPKIWLGAENFVRRKFLSAEFLSIIKYALNLLAESIVSERWII